MSDDTKMLFSVAALVVAGAVGVALVAACDSGTGERVRPVESARPAATPAADSTDPFEVEPMPFAEPAPAPVPVTVVEEAPAADVRTEEALRIDPGADFVRRGLETYRTRDFEESAAYFEAEIAERPGRAWTHYMLGLALWKSGKLDEAAVAMRESTAIDPTSIKAFVNLSRIENDRGQFRAALEAADAATALDGDDTSALFLRGRSLRNLGRTDEAIGAFEASLALDPDNGHVRNLYGLALLARGRAPEAVTELERAAELLPEVAHVRNNLGMAMEHAGRAPEAVAAYRVAVDLDPQHDKAAANLARLEPTVVAAGGPFEPAHGDSDADDGGEGEGEDEDAEADLSPSATDPDASGTVPETDGPSTS